MKKVYFITFLSFISYTKAAKQGAILPAHKEHRVPSLQKLASLKVWDVVSTPGAKGLENPPALYPRIVEVLEKHQPSKVEVTTLLCQAAKINHLPLTKALIKAKADVNAKNWCREIPLYIAVEQGYLDIVRELIKAGVDVNAKSWGVNVPLYIAAKQGHLDIVRELIKAGADLNAKSCYWEFPLYIAAEQGHLDIVRELIKAGANVNEKTNIDRKNTLHIAAEKGHLDIVRELIKAGADLNAKNFRGDNSLSLALEYKHKDVARFLRSHKTAKCCYCSIS